jgi:hypothetical protein
MPSCRKLLTNADDSPKSSYQEERRKMLTDDEMHSMPWTRGGLPIEEFEQWYASRKEVARSVDIETAEIEHWYACNADPYGILEAKGELPEAMRPFGKNWWVRTANTRGWVCEDDLSVEQYKAMCDRLKRDRSAYDLFDKMISSAASILKVPVEANFDEHQYIDDCFLVDRVLRDAISEFSVSRGVLDIRTIRYLVWHAIEAGIRSGVK